MAKKKSKKSTADRSTKKTTAAGTGAKTASKTAKSAKSGAKSATQAGGKAAKVAAGKAATGKSAAATRKPAAKSTAATAKSAASADSRAKSAPEPTTNGSRNGHAAGRSGVHGNGFIPHPHQPLSDDELRAVKTGLTRKELQHFRAVLLEKRAEIFGDVQGMQEARNSANGGDISHMPLHMADVGSDNYEQEFTLGLMESERRTIVEIDEALARIHNGTYGVCIESGQPIPRARLEIKPWAKYCIEVARDRERRGLL